MAGSWNHIVKDGKLLRNEDAVRMLENGGDWYEFAEEAYGMVYYLANTLQMEGVNQSIPSMIEEARDNYQEGLTYSPGTDGVLVEDEFDPSIYYAIVTLNDISVAETVSIERSLGAVKVVVIHTENGLEIYCYDYDEFLHAITVLGPGSYTIRINQGATNVT